MDHMAIAIRKESEMGIGSVGRAVSSIVLSGCASSHGGAERALAARA